jgi:hypothetical protein
VSAIRDGSDRTVTFQIVLVLPTAISEVSVMALPYPHANATAAVPVQTASSESNVRTTVTETMATASIMLLHLTVSAPEIGLAPTVLRRSVPKHVLETEIVAEIQIHRIVFALEATVWRIAQYCKFLMLLW